MPVIEQLEHSADYYVRIVADDAEDLFKGGLMSIVMYCVADVDTLQSYNITISEPCKLSAESIEELFVRFLNEILYKMDEKNAVFFDISINRLTGNLLDATIYGVSRSTVDMEREIKSATYHNLAIEQVMKKVTATVLFDV